MWRPTSERESRLITEKRTRLPDPLARMASILRGLKIRPGQALPAIHLKTLGTSGGDATEIWIDVAKRLPLRIRHVDRKGETFDQTVEEMEIE